MNDLELQRSVELLAYNVQFDLFSKIHIQIREQVDSQSWDQVREDVHNRIYEIVRGQVGDKLKPQLDIYGGF
jgi:hypothetical protein